MFHKLTSITPLPDYLLKAVFEDGSERQYDIKPLFEKWGVFRALTENDLFLSVKVDDGGYGISWNDEIDLSCDELYCNGVVQCN